MKVVDSVSVGRKPSLKEASTSYRVPGDRPDSFFIAVPVTVVMVIGGLLQGWVSSVRYWMVYRLGRSTWVGNGYNDGNLRKGYLLDYHFRKRMGRGAGL